MKRNKLFISIFVLLFSIVTLGTVTYAWFSVGTKADIQNFEVQATTGAGNMEVAVSYGDILPTNWGPMISTTQMNTLLATKYASKGLALNAITSKDGKAFNNFKNGAFNPNPVTEADSEYLSFKIYFRTLDATTVKWTKAQLNSNPNTLDSGHTGWKNLDGTNNTGQSSQHYMHHAARISIYAPTLNAPVFAYEHHIDKNASEPGIDATNIILGNGTSLQTNGDWGAHSFFRVTTGITLDLSNIETIDTQNVNETQPDILSLETETDGYYMGYVTVNVWLEGWDQNTFDGLLKATLSISLGFERT